MSDTNDKNKNENNPGNNSLFLYTALIFIAAIIIIIFAYFTQAHVERTQPLPASEAVAEPYDPDAPIQTAAAETGGPQGIAKTAAELSQDNLELLEENRALHNRVDELEAQLEICEPLIEAYHALSTDDKERLKLILEDINYDSLSDEAKTLYDFISSNIQ